MKRTLIKQGGAGLTIYVPKKWLDQRGLKAGDEVEITSLNNDLLLSAQGANHIKMKEILIESGSRSLLRSVVASAYKAGYDEIRLHCKVLPKIQELNEMTNSFTGLEVVTHNKNTVVLKSFIQANKDEVEHLIVKIFQNINVLTSSVDEQWPNIDLESAHTLVYVNIRRLRDHCLRTIHQCHYGEDKSYDYYDLVTQLEKIAAVVYEMAELIAAKKIHNKKEVQELARRFKELYEVYLKKNAAEADSLWEKQNGETKRSIQHSAFSQQYYLMKKYLHVASRIVSLCT